jgi:drug/metabolite transporter (DMT)-like permease
MDWKSMALGIVFVAMWSSAFTSARIMVGEAPPFLALSLRFLISGGLALAIGWALGQRIRLTRAQWGLVVVFGICQNALYLGLFFEAMRTVEASLAAVIASMLPLLVAGLGRAFLNERLPPVAALGLLVGALGVAIIMSSRISQGADVYGVTLCVIGALALAAATLSARGASGGGNLWIVVGLQMLVGSIALFPAAVLLEDWTVTWGMPLYLSFAYTTLVPGLAATVIWFVVIERIGATRAATFHFLNPFFGVAIAAAVLGETVGLRDLIGVAVVMVGILAVQFAKTRAPKAARTRAG